MKSFEQLNLMNLNWQELANSFLHEALKFGGRLAICILLYWFGRILIKYVNRLLGNLMSARQFDPSVASFLKSLISIILTAALLMMIINIVGINTSSFIALLASIGVAMGMALSGTLQNFAGGVMILLFRPYKVGDLIDAQGQSGTVKEIQIFNTVLTTADNRNVYMPNGGMSGNTIVNYSTQKTRRLEWVFGVGYGTDFDYAKQVISKILADNKRILTTPEPSIVLKTLNESSVDIQVRVWVATADYWTVCYEINELIYKTFTEKGIDIPFPQMTVHLANDTQTKA
ncbi:MAG: mechanosensitive ion channel [Candidatus Symbiothrix sp.]|jgi:small conductance mechanosensitive channel|nr:mechanosensitive ion channel [Candidatus Symbiothrix sp.]